MKNFLDLIRTAALLVPARFFVILALCAVAILFSKIQRASSEDFYDLGEATQNSFLAGDMKKSQEQANEWLSLASRFRKNWNYGNAIHDGNVILGRVAVREDRIEDAKGHLISAGKTPGSPQLASFGPEMALAHDLLLKGEREVVLQYIDLCSEFWEMHQGDLDLWREQVQNGEVPDFGYNLRLDWRALHPN